MNIFDEIALITISYSILTSSFLIRLTHIITMMVTYITRKSYFHWCYLCLRLPYITHMLNPLLPFEQVLTDTIAFSVIYSVFCFLQWNSVLFLELTEISSWTCIDNSLKCFSIFVLHQYSWWTLTAFPQTCSDVNLTTSFLIWCQSFINNESGNPSMTVSQIHKGTKHDEGKSNRISRSLVGYKILLPIIALLY